jgi:hypothetical protein
MRPQRTRRPQSDCQYPLCVAPCTPWLAFFALPMVRGQMGALDVGDAWPIAMENDCLWGWRCDTLASVRPGWRGGLVDALTKSGSRDGLPSRPPHHRTCGSAYGGSTKDLSPGPE